MELCCCLTVYVSHLVEPLKILDIEIKFGNEYISCSWLSGDDCGVFILFYCCYHFNVKVDMDMHCICNNV